jgi:hypothetical protein
MGRMTLSPETGAGVDDLTWQTLMDQPLSRWWCALGWIAATAVFIGLTKAIGGPTYNDSPLSALSTWTIAHGNLACAYPPANAYPFPTVAPLYPLLTGGLEALFRVGHAVPFPSHLVLGTHCANAYHPVYRWAIKSGAWLTTIRLGYLSWLALLGGAVALLRSIGRGRTFWEPAALLLMACTVPVALCLEEYFHPQDILALGLSLAALACVRKGQWIGAGVLIGLAFSTQPYAVLVAAPLFVIAPRSRRLAYGASAIGAVVLISVPIIVATSGRALRATIMGTSRVGSFNQSNGGTLMWEPHFRGVLIFTLARLLPIAVAVALAAWATRRLGSSMLEPVPLLSLVATSLGLRLALDVNLFGYYFLAVAVCLVLLDVARGRIRGEVIVWIALVSMVYNPLPWHIPADGPSTGIGLYKATAIAVIAVVLIVFARSALRHRIRWYLLVWLALATSSLVIGGWQLSPYGHPFPTWLWQILLVAPALALAVEPLLSRIRDQSAPAASPSPVLN